MVLMTEARIAPAPAKPWALRSRKLVLPEKIVSGAVHVEGGKILRVAAHDEVPEGWDTVDVGDLAVLPGLVDSHVHVNEPGRTEWEGFETATRAAAAGGVTCMMDMPLNSIPPTTTLAGLEAKQRAAEGKLFVDVGLCGGAVPGNAGELEALFRAGALAFKCFLAESGVSEFSHLDERALGDAMRVLAGVGAPLLVHAELPGPLDEAARALGEPAADAARRYATYLASRPKTAEDAAVDLVIRLSKELGTRAHVVHLSSSTALPLVRKARDEHVPLSVETCPHYLSLASESIPDGATEYKCAPPIREGQNRERLWDALREGLIDQVVTDHSPSTPSLKCSDSGDFMRAWGGIASLQLGLPVVWTEARARGRTLIDVARWMSSAPASLIALSARKGAIAPGRDADFVVFDPDADMVVEPATLHHRHKLTPYARKKLHGVVTATYLRGRKVYERGAHLGSASGALLRR
jgi:allantoinase